MAANKTVVVLAPNGRRQNVKVTINTTILQVLEEVCQKQGFNVDDYDIKHNRKILDLNTIFRFTGLPNNAQLEMVACTKARSSSNVTIGIQPEDGERIMRDFLPNSTLAQVLTEIYPNSNLDKAVLIYMHREVYGRKVLEKTTLKSLGLNSGKAILRLIYRDPEQLKTQAHISMPLLPKSATTTDSSSNKDDQRASSSMLQCNKTMDDINLSMKNVSNMQNQENEEVVAKTDMKDNKVDAFSSKRQEIDTFMKKENPSVISNQKNLKKDQDTMQTSIKDMQENTYEIKFLGERNALVFNQARTEALPRDELPDSFFDLDLHDAKTLLRDAKRRREQIENAPLQTEAQRQLDRDKRTLDHLNKYRRTVIRVQFPDQFVLQGLFGPLETIQSIKDFIRNYLDNPDGEFTIYTTPPKHILNSDARLIDENLVPSAIIYYSGQSLLKSNVKAKLTDPRAAGIEAVKSRTTQKEQESTAEEDHDRDIVTIENKCNEITPGPSGSGKSSSVQNKTKPKWFKSFK